MAIRFLDSGPAEAAPVAVQPDMGLPRGSGLRRVGQFQTPFLDRLASEGPAFDREPAAPPTPAMPTAEPEPAPAIPPVDVSRETQPRSFGLRSVGAKPAQPDPEAEFQRGIRGTEWFRQFVAEHGEEPNLNDPDYDYRRAWAAGVRPAPYEHDGGRHHWPSVDPSGKPLKSPNHPTAWMEGFMQETGQDPVALGLKTPQEGEAWKQQQKQAAYDTLPWTERAGAQLQSGVETLKQTAAGTLAKAGGTQLSIMDRIDRGERVTEMEDPAGYQHMPPEDRQALRAQTWAGLAKNIGRIASADAAQQKLPRNPAADALVQRANAGDWSGAWQAFTSDPAGVLQQFSLESAPLAAPSMVAGIGGAAVGGVPGLLIGLAGGSYPVEYGVAIVDLLRERNIDPQNAAAVEAALRDPAFLEEAGKRGNTRGTAIAAFDAAGGRLAGPMVRGAGIRNLGVAARNVAAETGTEMAGEAAAQIGTKGKIEAGEVLAEGLGGGPQAVATTAGSTIANSFPQADAAAQQGAAQPERQEPFFEQRPAGTPPPVDLPPVPPSYPFTEGGFQQPQPAAEPRLVPEPERTAPPQMFEPTADWQDVPPGAILPPGLEIQMDMQTGRQRARRPVPQPDLQSIMDDERSVEEIAAEREAQQQAAIEEAEQRASDWPVEPGPVDVQFQDGTTAKAELLGFDQRGRPALRMEDGRVVRPLPDRVSITPAKPEGTAANPVVVETAEDLERAAALTDPDPTPEKAEAGTYAKGVVDWQGLKINIETPKGGERTAKDGSWSVPDFPAHYGEVRRTTGADGDPVDVYMGDDVQSTQVWVIDQKFPDTGKFDEHKVMLGFGSPEAALAVYERAFSDGSAQSRIGAMTPMTLRQFKNWLKNGDNTKPVKYVPAAGLAPKKKASLGRPMDAAEFIAANGGLSDPTGELRAMDAQKVMIPRLGNILRKNGLEPDRMREAMEEAGYLPPGSTPNDMFDLLRGSLAARKAGDFRNRGWSLKDSDWLVEQIGQQAAQDSSRQEAETRAEVARLVKTAGGDLAPQEFDRVMELVGAGEEIEEAIYTVMMARSLDDDAFAAKAEEQVGYDGDETPFPDAADGQRAAGQEPDPAADRRPEGQPVSQDQEQAPAGSDAGGTETVAQERGSSREDQGEPQGEVAAPPATEQTAQGEQAVIPGAERISDRELAERRMEGGKKPKAAQQPADEGLFDTGARNQTAMFQRGEGNRQRRRRGAPLPLTTADGVVADEIPLLPDAKGFVRLAPEYVARREEIAREVAKVITRMTGRTDMNVIVTDKLMGKVETTGEWVPVGGVVSPVDRLLAMAADNPDIMGTARHESIHLLREFGIVTPAEWAILRNAAEENDWLGKHNIETIYPDLKREGQLEEAIAEEFGRGDFNSDVRSAAVNQIFRKIAEFLRRVRAALRRVIGKDPDWQDIFSAIESGQLANDEVTSAMPAPAMAQRSKRGPAWHGTPHEFDKFSLEKIGTGEGAQAYGWGLYFAGNREVAEHYRRSLAGQPRIALEVKGGFFKKGERIDTASLSLATQQILAENDYDLDKAIEHMGIYSMSEITEDRKTLQRIREKGGKTVTIQPGRLYQVNLVPKEDEYLLWDKPLSEQSEKVKAALKASALPRDLYQRNDGEWRNTKGEDFYRTLSESLYDQTPLTTGGFPPIDGMGDDRAASLALRKSGIPGIKYLDGMSRRQGEGNYNYVIFDDSLVKVTAKFQRRPGWFDPAGKGPNDFVPAPDHARDFGRISEEVAQAAGLQPLSIRLRVGNPAFGYKHIAQRHGSKLIKEAGSVENFVYEVARNFNRVGRTAHGDIRLTRTGDPNWAIGVDLREEGPPNGRYYSVVTAFTTPVSREDLLWEEVRTPSSKDVGDPTPLLDATQDTDKSTPPRRGQSKRNILSLPEKDKGSAETADSAQESQKPKFQRQQAPAQLFGRGFDAPSEQIWEYLQDRNLPLMARVRATGKAFTEAARQKLQDKYLPLRRTQEAIEKARGAALDEGVNAYLAEELYHGRTGKRLDDFRNDTVEPLVEAINKEGLTLEEVDEYLYARHAKERNAQIASINEDMPDGGSGMTNAEADAVLAKYAAAEKDAALKRIAAKVDAIIADTMKVRLEAGLLDEETAKLWGDTYKHYVPLRGFAEQDLDAADRVDLRPRTGRGFDVRGKESKQAFGRESKAGDILANILTMHEEAVVRAEKNRVGQAFLKLVQQNPHPDMWEIAKVEQKPHINKTTGMVEYGPDPLSRLKDNVLSVKVDGKPVFVTIHHAGLARAMKNIGAETANGFLRALQRFNRYLAFVNTSLNPEFVLSNFARDIQTAAINLQGVEVPKLARRAIRDVPKALRGGYLALRGDKSSTWAQHFQEYAKAGGKTEFFALDDITAKKKQIERLLADINPDKLGRIRQLATATEKAVQDLNGAVENGIRLAVYVNLRKAGATEKQAASIAKNLTVNFNRKGEWAGTMTALYLFYNASIQGTVRMLQAMKHPKVQLVVAGIVVAHAMLDVLNGLLAPEDDDKENRYDKIPDYTKNHNIIVVNPFAEKGDKSIVGLKVPVPYGYNVFAVTGYKIGEQIRSAMGIGKKRDPWKQAADLLVVAMESFNPIGGEANLIKTIVPTALQPLYELETNRNFMEAPIMPEQPQFGPKKPDSQRHFKSVSAASKAFAQWLNEATGGNTVRPGAIDISPETFDHWVEFMTGGAGAFVNRSSDFFYKVLSGKTDELSWNKVPFARRVVEGQNPYYTRSRFYQIRDAAELASLDLKTAAKDGRAKEVREKYRPELIAAAMLKDADKTLKDLNKSRRLIEASKTLSEDDKRGRLKRIDDNAQRIMMRITARYNEEVRKVDR